ncbi:MAG: hypothetical protein HY043_18840 [Verrucomicrobia bacterium]|nr:hypothetical protein [Verrucomicrobiota bacterium]
MKTKPDEPLEDIWAARRRIAERFGFDPRKQTEQLRRRQEAAKDRFYRRANEFTAASETLVLRDAPPKPK